MAVLYKFHEIEAILANDSQFLDVEKLLPALERIQAAIPLPPLEFSDFLNKNEHPLYLKEAAMNLRSPTLMSPRSAHP
ncbi:MAG: hypothetical protein H7836_12240 [Magnetococcus sp. YQC-3]